MPITYKVLVDWDEDGAFAAADADISADVLALVWRLGMTEPHQHVAPPGVARITLRNHDRRYSPEVGMRFLLPGKRLRIQSSESSLHTHFTGFIESVEPQPGTHGERTAVVHAATADAQIAQVTARLPPLVNACSDRVVLALLNSTPLRRAGLASMWVLETEGYGELNDKTRLASDETIPRSLEGGISTFAYVGDLWNIPMDAALRQTVDSERGRFFIDREGRAVFYNRHHTLRAAPPSAAFADDVEKLTYLHGGDFVNHVQVTVLPRRIGAPNSPLWTLENNQRIPPGRRRIVVSYRNAEGMPIGALAVTHLTFSANSKPDGSGDPVPVSASIIEAGGNSAVLELHNPSGSTAYLQPGAQLFGTPLITGAPIGVEHVDALSTTFHGRRTLALDLPLVDSADEADQMARYELRLRCQPMGIVKAIATSTRTHPQHVLALTLFDRIRVRETQTGHDAQYLIVGEAHEVDLGGTRHRVRWIVEPADPTRFWQIDLSRLDETATVAY